MLPYFGILILDLFAVWLSFRTARRLFNPEKYISNREKEYSKILAHMFGVTIDEHRSKRGNRFLAYLALLTAFLFWLAFLFHLFFFVTKLLGK